MAQYLPPESLKVGNGVETVFGFTFPYLRKEDIAVTVNGLPVPWVLVGTAQVYVTPAPGDQAVVRMYRDTPAQFPAHQFSTGVPMLPKYIDENNRQLLYALQEGLLEFSDTQDTAEEALAAAQAAQDAAEDAAASAAQQAQNIRRTLRVATAEPEIPTLPAIAARANKILGFDAAGNPVGVLPGTGTALELALDLANPVDPDKGAAMVGYRGGSVASELTRLATYSVVGVDSVHTLLSCDLVSTRLYRCSRYHAGHPGGGGDFRYMPGLARSNHNGGTIISPTVPWNGSEGTLDAFLRGEGETAPAAFGCFVRSDYSCAVANFGAIPSGAVSAVQAFRNTWAWLVQQAVTETTMQALDGAKYLIDDTVVLSGAFPFSNGVHFKGKAQFLCSHAGAGFRVDGSAGRGQGLVLGHVFEDWYFQKTGALRASGSRGIEFLSGGDPTANRIFFRNCKFDFFASGVFIDGFINYYFEGTDFYQNNIGTDFANGSSIGTNNVVDMHNCRFFGNNKHVRSTMGRSFQFTSCQFEYALVDQSTDFALHFTNTYRLSFVSCWFEANGNTAATLRVVLANLTDTSILLDNCTFANNSLASKSSPYHIAVASTQPYKIMVRGGQWTTDNLTKTLNDASGNGIVSVAGVLAANWTSSSAATRIGYTSQGANADVGSFGELTVVSPIKSGYPRMVNTTFGATTIGFTGTQWLASTDNTVDLGAAGARFAVVRAGTGTINTSDIRDKEQQRDISEVERGVAVTLKGMLRAYKWVDSVAAKGESARWHFGIMAQDLGDVFREAGLDPEHYGMFCYDAWEDTVDPDTGAMVYPAGDKYGIRYDQLFAFILASM